MHYANAFGGGAVQPAKEALDAAVRMRQAARTPQVKDKPFLAATRNAKILVPARESPTRGDAVFVGSVDQRLSMLKPPGFMSAKTEASFAAAASLGSDRPLSAAALTTTRRRLVEPVDSRNPRVGRGMAKIYSGEVHAMRFTTRCHTHWFTHHISRMISPFKEIEDDDQERSPKPRQKHFKSKTLGFSVPADTDVDKRALIPVKDGKPSAVQALSLREASDRRGVTTHVPKEIVNSTKKESANSAALQVAARAAREQASTLVKLG